MNRPVLMALSLLVAGCAGATSEDHPFTVRSVAEFREPWAMTFLPDGRLLVTEKPGTLLLVDPAGTKVMVSGVPEVDFGGQGGLGDVVLHPEFASNGLVYLSYAEAGDKGLRGAAVARGRLVFSGSEAALEAVTVIWRQVPKMAGRGHYGHRMAFDSDGYLFISSGERQAFDPAQDLDSNLGKIVRLYDDGSVPNDNPFQGQGEIAAQVWTLGHRNPLGLAFDTDGRLWNHEMGPRHGDELNLVVRGRNYGYPLVSNGDHYSGEAIPDHDTRPDLEAPKLWWDPTIAPGGLMFYQGQRFEGWRGSAFIAGLASQALIRVVFDGIEAREAERFAMSERLREVEEGPDGAIWLLEDGVGGRLLELTPRP